MKKKKHVQSFSKKIIIINIFLFVLLMMGVGYSVLGNNLILTGNIGVSKYDHTLYGVLEEAAQNGNLAKEYTGSHHDSFTEEPSHNIYRFDATNDQERNKILNINNVIFAGQCWQMVRTTDTGGVKMIYNGEAVDNQCLSSRGTHVGYSGRTSQNLASSYWYGTDYTYDSTAKTFKVSGTTEQTIWNATTGPGLIGKYTCMLTNVNDSCSTLYLIESYYNASSAYVIPLNSNSHYSEFGTLPFNAKSNSLAHAGYMYNAVYPINTKMLTMSESVLSSTSLSTSYWYAHNAIWGSPKANSYNLESPYQVSATTDYPNLVGEYTFRSSNQTSALNAVYYIAGVNNTTMYYIKLMDSENHTLSDYDDTYTYGVSFTDNGNGTYTINNPTTVKKSDWYTSYSNVGAHKYVCKNAVNDTCSNLWYTTSTSNTSMTYITSSDVYKYSKGFTWDGVKYVLDDDTSTSFWNIIDNADILSNAHYTCWNNTGECTSISYIYYYSGFTPYYVNLTNGKSIDDVKNEMLYNNDINQINSTMKSGVDAWYKHYLLDRYDNYIEDTIFCNNRSQSNSDTNGWNPNGGDIHSLMYFKEYDITSDLSCTNITDQFSVSNNNAKLTYKVGLMSSPEMNMEITNFYGTAHYGFQTGNRYWLLSPSSLFIDAPKGRFVSTEGSLSYDDANAFFGVDHGVRPAISLKPGIEYSSGDGSKNNPYVVVTN